VTGALFNDLAQRLLTGNKWEQRRQLRRKLTDLRAAPGEKILDFGCGTGLFFPTLQSMGLKYFGYDIDEGFLRYAQRRYPAGTFFSSPKARRDAGPYDLLLANCCFHHVDDDSLKKELKELRSLLAPGGRVLVIDLLFPETDRSFLRAQFRRLERGLHIRTIEAYENLLAPHFRVRKKEEARSHVFSLKGNPVYGHLALFECDARD